MKRLIVQMRPSDAARGRGDDGYTRPSREELRRRADANAQHFQACADAVRRALPERHEMVVMANLGVLVVSYADTVDSDDLKSRIFAACPHVENVGSDCDMHLVK